MTVQDIIDALSDYGFTDTTTTRKMEKINATLWDITSREPWPFMQTTIDLTFDGINAVATNSPTDFQSALDLIRQDTGRKLQPLRMEEADAELNLALASTGLPSYYYFIGNALNFAPIPPAGLVVRMRYVKKHAALLQTDVEAAILIPREHHEVLLYGTLVKLYDLEDDTDLSVRFQQLYENKYQDMRGAIWMKQYDRPQRIQIVDQYSDDYDF
jgi:hypothetical protein